MSKSPDRIGLARLLKPFITLSLLCVGLYVLQAAAVPGLGDWYLNWNLVLAWLPLLFALALLRVLRRYAWSSWRGVALTALWLGFLPNSFYIVTDFIHLPDAAPEHLLFSVVLFSAYTLAGLLLGYASLALVHMEMRRYAGHGATIGWVLFVLLLCSFAIYLGRDLRWNTWDLVINPAAILFDVSDRLIQPYAHAQVFATTATFWVFLSGLYFSLVQLTRIVRSYPTTRL